MSLENFPNFFLNFSERDVNDEERHFYSFKSFRLNIKERQLLQNNSTVSLTPKAFDVLAVLVERSGHLVEKDELLRIVWADSFVEEINVARIVHTLRKVLGENDGDKFIETVAKKGYRFVAEVNEIREPITRNSGNGKTEVLSDVQELSEVTSLEKSPEIEPPIPINDETVAPPVAAEPKQMKRFILFAIGFATAIFLILFLSFNFSSKSSVNPNEVRSIAVLPLRSIAAESRDARYELGIADALIQKISPSKNLIVRQLSAVQDYADTKKDPITIGREQKVDYVLVSNYQIADGKIRITSQLINVADGTVEESFKDEQNAASFFALQDEIAANVGRKILTKLNRESNNLTVRRYTENDEAYRLYLLSAALVDKRNRKDAEKAVEYLEQVVRLDPNYALAYARLANAYSTAGTFGGDRSAQYPKQKAAIEKALALDENLAEAYSYLGEMKLNYEWDFDGAERALKKGVELNPNSAVAHQMFALYLNSMGRTDEAIAHSKTAIDLDPRSVIIQRIYGDSLFTARRYDEAIAQYERTIQMDPTFRMAYGWIIGAYQAKGEDDKAFEWFLRAPHRKDEAAEKIELWKTLYAQSGWRGIYRKQLEDAKQEEKEGKTPYWEMARLYADLDDKEQAMIYLQKAFELNQRGWGWTRLKVDPKYDLIRDDPRFHEIVRRVGLK